ncbi:hypothetical protein CBS101457_005517 [Exobasidium rhododendri]|nr:hypothetical protein CBS101457_005517 [Exobasidium rhododendri]
MSSTAQDLLSATKDGADAVAITLRSKISYWWYRGDVLHNEAAQSTLQLLLRPRLPPLLSPLPYLFRLIAFLILAPVIFICLVDFAGYAIFRTLGLQRQRVQVKKTSTPRINLSPLIDKRSGSTVAPVLTPGAYDADALLLHRQRSASAASADAIQEWARTGGTFARVSNVRARAAAHASGEADLGLNVPDLVSAPDSPKAGFGRASGVGVEGALGYFDTDAEDSGAESGLNSPEVGRKALRKGLGGGALGFTPVSSEGAATRGALGVVVPSAMIIDDLDRSPRYNDSVTSSWVRLDESSTEENSTSDSVAKALAADVEPVTGV